MVTIMMMITLMINAGHVGGCEDAGSGFGPDESRWSLQHHESAGDFQIVKLSNFLKGDFRIFSITLKPLHQYELEFHVDPSGVGFDLVVTVPILVIEQHFKTGQNCATGGNDSSRLDHPNFCSSAHLGRSIGSYKPRCCACGTATVSLSCWT